MTIARMTMTAAAAALAVGAIAAGGGSAQATTLPNCPATVLSGIAFPPAPGYACIQQDKIWFNFQDLGAGIAGDNAIPAGVTVHTDLSATYPYPDIHNITLDNTTNAQFAPGTYSWSYDVVELAPNFKDITGASESITWIGLQPVTFTSVLNGLTVDSYNGYNLAPSVTVGGVIATLSSNTGLSIEIPVGQIAGIQFTDTLVVRPTDVVQSITNDVVQYTPEPLTLAVLGSGLLGLFAVRRRR